MRYEVVSSRTREAHEKAKGMHPRELRALAPAPDLGVHVHAIPVFGAVPADLIFGELLADFRRGTSPGSPPAPLAQTYCRAVHPRLCVAKSQHALKLRFRAVVDGGPPQEGLIQAGASTFLVR